jgi:hypothetical protein
MLRTTKTFDIAAEPGDVFRYLIDAEVSPPGVEMRMEPVHETPEGVGNVYRWTWKMLGLRFTGITVYTEYVPDQRMSWKDFGLIENANTWIIAPDDDGTRLTVHINTKLRIPLLGRLLEPLLVRQMEKVMRAGIDEVERQAARAKAAA